ncbi:MAG: hypothetical protein ACOWWR_19895 [Eubacteriales bacterium]
MKKNIIPDSSKIMATIKQNNYPPIPTYPPNVVPGGNGSPGMPGRPMMPPTSGMQPGTPIQVTPPILGNTNYIQAYLKQFIGEFVRIDFLIGTGTFIDRDGILTNVGVDYIELREVQTGNTIVADLYSIKFVTVYSTNQAAMY